MGSFPHHKVKIKCHNRCKVACHLVGLQENSTSDGLQSYLPRLLNSRGQHLCIPCMFAAHIYQVSVTKDVLSKHLWNDCINQIQSLERSIWALENRLVKNKLAH